MADKLDRLRTVARAYRRAEALRPELFELIADAADAKVEQKTIVEITGFTREHVRRIVEKVRDERAKKAAAAQPAAE